MMASAAVNEEKPAFVHLQMIQIAMSTRPGESTSTTGIFAVSLVIPTYATNCSSSSDQNNHKILLLQVASGNNVYFESRQSIPQICNDLKLDRSSIILSQESASNGMKSVSSPTTCPPPEVVQLAGLLKSTSSSSLQKASERQITFEMTGDECDAALLRITIKERMKTGMVRLLWSTQLSSLSDTSGSSLFDLSLRLFQQQEDLATQLETLKSQFSLLEQDRNGWKDTATKLEGEWEEEKSMLFQNFCDLYSAKHEHDKSKVEGLQQEISKLKEEVSEAKTSHRATSARATAALPECFQNLPDDVDHREGAAYDAETVSLLAQGKRLPLPKRRCNPTTGATEYFDADAALEDVILQAASRPLAKRARVSAKTEESDSKPSAALSSKRETKAMPPAVKKKEAKPPTKAAASDSETGSDDDFAKYVDKDMEAEILANIAALPKR